MPRSSRYSLSGSGADRDFVTVDLLLTLLKGMAIGFAMAVPVGPVGLLCIRRTLNYGLVIGLLSGLGAALADAPFAAAAAGGLASLMDFLLGIERQLRVAGGVFLVALGIWTFFKHRSEEHTSELQSLMRLSYAVFSLTKQKHIT